ncbi:glucosamine-6-phosphate deaminase [Pedobacter mucosus]|uniref:glucosamine-6-phosphate deaminase n=1 Tax=Pedobacter mucosus TaxID=2895286 RepID=UPI001EE46758|nr:glucosamine-6-phosphate deaminase [Pedobacter mucosus]UKT66120.1 glucosamine-6-phosphate deaminase [Pedobacter mucosus]
MSTITNSLYPKIEIFETRKMMGENAAEKVALKIIKVLESRSEINIVFAAAPSQDEFLAAFIKQNLPWEKINAFHMDEYVGLDKEAPQGFGNFLRDRIFGLHNFKSVHYLNGNEANPSIETERYTQLLKNHPVDMVCLGIGENGHLAFNDPPVADFEDKQAVKLVELDEACRQQQVNDGCFSDIEQVPTHALTLTIPSLINAKYLFCIVPGIRKAEAVFNTLDKPISHEFPSTILRNHDETIIFLDRESSSLL